jgi:hypothetical protein
MSTPKIVDYTVVMEEQSLDSLITKVRNLIGEGWQPLGPMQATGTISQKFFQTMVRPDDALARLGHRVVGSP